MIDDFDIRDFGARPGADGLNTRAIQAAIDACHEAGGGRVVCPPGRFRTGSLELKSRVELHLMAGAVLAGSPRAEDYADFAAPGFRPEAAPEHTTKSLIRAVHAEDVAVTGPGAIDGSGLAFYDTQGAAGRFFRKPDIPRPRTVMMFECRNIRFQDTAFLDSPCWTFWLMKCERVRIHRITIQGDQRMINNDGIDLDSCRDVTVSDCIIRTGDDCLVLRAIRRLYETPAPCEHVTVANCVLDSGCQGVRVGCPEDGVIQNCTFTNLTIASGNNGILFEFPRRYLHAAEGGTADIHDILFANVVADCAGSPVKVVVEDGIAIPRVGGLRFSNFRVRSAAPCVVQGSPQTIVRDVEFTDFSLSSRGNDTLICRYCENVRFTNVRISHGE